MGGELNHCSRTCDQCGSILQEGDVFCGSCGVHVPSSQHVPQGKSSPEDDAESSLLRRWVSVPRWAIAGGVLVLAILLIGIGVVVAGTIRGDVEVAPGVYTKIPEGWVVSSSSTIDGSSSIPAKTKNYTHLVPEAYKDEDPIKAPSVMFLGNSADLEKSEGQVSDSCKLQTSKVDSFSLPGYGTTTMGQGTLASGKGKVAGHDANWSILYTASVGPQISYPDYYPNYWVLLYTNVCVDDLPLCGIPY